MYGSEVKLWCTSRTRPEGSRGCLTSRTICSITVSKKCTNKHHAAQISAPLFIHTAFLFHCSVCRCSFIHDHPFTPFSIPAVRPSAFANLCFDPNPTRHQPSSPETSSDSSRPLLFLQLKKGPAKTKIHTPCLHTKVWPLNSLYRIPIPRHIKIPAHI
jgi:hypothetical protein